MLRLSRLVTAAFLAGCVCSASADASAELVSLDFFYSPGCAECDRFDRVVLPELEARFEGFYEMVRHDMTQTETIPLLLAYQQRCHNTLNSRISIVVDHTTFLSGYPIIATGLCDRVNEALRSRLAPGWEVPHPPLLTPAEAQSVVQTTTQTFTLPVVIIGGLVDGFNPCAISTLIFFMSVLAVIKATRRTRILVGVSFIVASFLVYTGLGFGFLYAFRQASEFALVRKTVETGLGLCMIPLAVFSFGDAVRFRKSQRADEVTLQIPHKIKRWIHSFINTRLGFGGPILGGLVTGAGVTLLESVCTGQSYAPVLTYILKADGFNLHAWGLLLLYNLLFVLPLTAIFICFHRGMQLRALIDWSKRNLVAVKILLGLFFAAMTVLLLWPR